ncbi:uncharacterized protein LOC133030494 [Cannabis sativa]|uniref:uncharacterized protein LOC133030494 n=1 Tax=Cannabis sativa TaxID=3483 RepID=UPI0029CA612E|nr:uncharacterized protein LOC133030494 [Cannabis sativa]
MESLMSKYWWSSGGRKGVSWFSWRKLCKTKNSRGMGFRSLREYNLSLLGRVGWQSEFYIWRSVFESQTLLKDGARRRIGPGSSTEVLNTPWLLSEDNPCVVSNHPALTNCKVSQLMKPGSRQWDLELIENLFDSHYVELIKQSVNGSWNSSIEDDVWRMLWKIKAPLRFYILFGNLSGCLPTHTQLSSKHVPVELHCVLCSYGEESMFHVLVQCPFAHSCWLHSALGVGHSTTNNFFDWFMEVLAVGNMGLVEEAVMVGWAIWKARNDILWNGRSCSAADVIWLARTTLRQWTSAQSKRLGSVSLASNRTDTRDYWSKPAAGQLKINVDGAVFEATNKIGTSFVARDCDD